MGNKLKLLNIATIMPVPEEHSKGFLKNNDFLLVIAEHLKCHNVTVDFIKIAPWSNKLMARLRRKWFNYYNVPPSYAINSFEVDVIKTFSFPGQKYKLLALLLTCIVSFKQLVKIKCNYDCLHAHYLYFDGFLAYYLHKKYKVPYILTIRNEAKLLKSFGFRWFAKKIVNSATSLVVMNIENKSSIEGLTGKDVHMIPHGILKQDLCNKTNVSKKIKITTVCSLIELKRVDVLLKALRYFNDRTYELHIIGSGPLYKQLLSMSEGLPCVFWGELENDQVINHLKLNDIFVMPSVNETFGRVYIEALATSNAVIAVKGTGIDGLFEEGKEVLYMEPGSVKSLRVLLERLLNDKEYIKSLKYQGFKAVEKEYLWDSIALKYLKIYRHAASQNQPVPSEGASGV